MTELDQTLAADEVDAYPSTIERAADVPQYVSAMSATAMVMLIVAVTVATQSVVATVAMVAISMVAGLWGSVYGLRVGRATMRHRVLLAEEEAARLRKAAAQQEADLARVGDRVEALAVEWDQQYPAVPEHCVRQLRDLLSIRMEDVR